MLDKYKDEQPIFYNLIKNSLNDGFLSHAYLIDENNNSNAFEIVLSFVKELLYMRCDEDKEIISDKVDNNNFPELSIIRPDGAFIKKEQLSKLQSDFSKKSLEGDIRIYIICDADRMKKEAENSILKFLEEPCDNIVAILMTNNITNILDTIVSRCQLVKLSNNDTISIDEKKYDMAVDFVLKLEAHDNSFLADSKRLWFDLIKDREDNYQIIGYMLDIYYNILRCKLGLNVKYDMEKFNSIVLNNNIGSLNEKIKILLKYLDNIRNNVHIPLFLDSLIIEMEGVK